MIDPQFSRWDNFFLREMFVTRQSVYKPDTKGFSQILFDEFLADPQRDQLFEEICLTLDAAQKIRDKFGQPLTITSGYRSERLNRIIKDSAPNSYHKQGKAIDFAIAMHPPWQVRRRLKDWEGGMGAYATFTHLDRGPKRRWS